MATEQDLHNWLAGYPRNWDQLCQALMWQAANQFGTVVSTPDSANTAYKMERDAGRIQGGTAPAGSFVYFDIGTYDHVGFVMNGGRVMMATSHLAEQWVNTDAGWNSVDAYCAATGARVYGWSWQNGGNTLPFTADGSGTGGGGTPGSDWAFNEPDQPTQARIQQGLANRGRYDGPIDGVWGPNTIMGIQTTIQNVGYTGPIDGVPGYNTCYYVQVYAQKFGDYTGPVDAILGPNSWDGFALGLERP